MPSLIRSGSSGTSRRTAPLPPSEGLVTGAVQVPPDGRPVVFLADHPTTGGYPVAVLLSDGDRELIVDGHHKIAAYRAEEVAPAVVRISLGQAYSAS